MADSKDLIRQVAREIEASQKTSTTPHGQTERGRDSTGEGHIEAINSVFTLFRLNYANQYYAAYPDAEHLTQIKKLWLNSLRNYPVEQILEGAKHAIEHCEYLPTLHRMHECCQQGLGELGLPTAHDAYMEACKAPSPKSAQNWSHPAVYLAGRDSDWFFLANNQERQTWPVFREHYQGYCSRVLQGESLVVPAPEALEKKVDKPMTKEEQLAALKNLRRESGL